MSPGPGQRPPGTSARAGRLPSGRSAERRAAPAAAPTPQSSGRTAAIARLFQSCRSQHSGSGATGPRLGRTAWRSRAGDSPSRGKRPRNAGTPAAARRGPWPARRQSPAGRPPAPASLRQGQTQIGDVEEAIGPANLHHVRARPLAFRPDFHQPQNPSHVSTLGQRTSAEIPDRRRTPNLATVPSATAPVTQVADDPKNAPQTLSGLLSARSPSPPG